MNPRPEKDEFTHAAGSPPAGEPVFLVIGKIRRPHGVQGELLMEVYSDFPERYQPGVTVFVGDGAQAYHIASCRRHKDGLLIKFTAFDTPEAAGILRNQLVYVRADDRPQLEEGEYYHHQLIGLKVIDEQGNSRGSVAEIMETGGNDVLVVRGEQGSDLLIPYVDEFILQVDLQARTLRVRLIPGMLDEE